jgi:transcriptional regulator GlxA family with amidase domain
VAISEGSAIGASYHQSLAIAYPFDRGVRCAIRWIIGHYSEALHVEELTALAMMSVSSFHRHFRAVTSMTPIQFQKQIRLHEARARLLAEPRDVAGVGFAVGYESTSRFSRQYRRIRRPPGPRRARAARGGSAAVDLGAGRGAALAQAVSGDTGQRPEAR